MNHEGSYISYRGVELTVDGVVRDAVYQLFRVSSDFSLLNEPLTDDDGKFVGTRYTITVTAMRDQDGHQPILNQRDFDAELDRQKNDRLFREMMREATLDPLKDTPKKSAHDHHEYVADNVSS